VSCAAPDQGQTAGPVADGATVLDGRVADAAGPVAGAYVRLLDRTGEFVAEVVSGPLGQFRFHVVPGTWTVRVLVPGAEAQREVATVSGANWVEVPLER
jgi:hypothetical protein